MEPVAVMVALLRRFSAPNPPSPPLDKSAHGRRRALFVAVNLITERAVIRSAIAYAV
jgi:hypothetical protein